MLDGKYLNAVNSLKTTESYPLWTTQDDSTGSHFLTYRKQAPATKNIIIGIQNSSTTYLTTNTGSSGGYVATTGKQLIIALSEKCPYTIKINDIIIKSGNTSFSIDTSSFESSYSVTINNIKQSTSITPVVVSTVYTDGELTSSSAGELSYYGTTYSYTDSGLRYARLFPDSDGSLKVYYDSQVLRADTTTSTSSVCDSSSYTHTATCTSTNKFTGGCSVVSCTDSSNNGCSYRTCDSCGDSTGNVPTIVNTKACDDSTSSYVALCSSNYCSASNYCNSDNSKYCNSGKGCGDNTAEEVAVDCYTCGCGGYGNSSKAGTPSGVGSTICQNSGYNNSQFVKISENTVKAYGSSTGNTYKIVYNSSTGTYTTYVTTNKGNTYVYNGICSDAGTASYIAASDGSSGSGSQQCVCYSISYNGCSGAGGGGGSGSSGCSGAGGGGSSGCSGAGGSGDGY